MEHGNGVGHVRPEALKGAQHLSAHRRRLVGWQIIADENFVSLGDPLGDSLSDKCQIVKIGHPQATAVDFIGVGGADTALGGADFVRTQGGFAGGVEFLVDWKHDVGTV